MRESEMQSFAGVCRYSAWDISMRMRRVAMKEKEGGEGRVVGAGNAVVMLEDGREESVRGGEEWEERNETPASEEATEAQGEEGDQDGEAEKRWMRVEDFVQVIDVGDMRQL